MNPMVESKTSPTKQTKVFVVAGTYTPKTKQKKRYSDLRTGHQSLKIRWADEKSRQNIVAVTLHRKKGLLTY